MPSSNIVKLNRVEPSTIDYMGHRIILKYRPDYNDWQYTITLHVSYTIKRQSAFYSVAVRDAKRFIDRMNAVKQPKKPVT